jgi:hypothetical protein
MVSCAFTETPAQILIGAARPIDAFRIVFFPMAAAWLQSAAKQIVALAAKNNVQTTSCKRSEARTKFALSCDPSMADKLLTAIDFAPDCSATVSVLKSTVDYADTRWKMLAMHGPVSRAGLVMIAISLCALPAGAVATGRTVQNASEAGKGVAEPVQGPVAGAPTALSADSPEQIRKAQIELRRLDCLSGRIDGKLGDQTRQAVRKFWGSAKQPIVDNFCRPPRRFFGFGGRALPPLLAPGARPGIVAPTAAQPVSPDAAH